MPRSPAKFIGASFARLMGIVAATISDAVAGCPSRQVLSGSTHGQPHGRAHLRRPRGGDAVGAWVGSRLPPGQVDWGPATTEDGDARGGARRYAWGGPPVDRGPPVELGCNLDRQGAGAGPARTARNAYPHAPQVVHAARAARGRTDRRGRTRLPVPRLRAQRTAQPELRPERRGRHAPGGRGLQHGRGRAGADEPASRWQPAAPRTARPRSTAAPLPPRHLLAAPLLLGHRLFGVLYLDRGLARGPFSEGDVEILIAIADHLALALETAHTERLARSQEAALDANRAKSTFIAHMSHELRTPLNGDHRLQRAARGGIPGSGG